MPKYRSKWVYFFLGHPVDVLHNGFSMCFANSIAIDYILVIIEGEQREKKMSRYFFLFLLIFLLTSVENGTYEVFVVQVVF